MDISKNSSILMICYGNICRSPMAEALLKNLIPDRGIEISSAGTHAGDGNRAEPNTIKAMLNFGIDISFHRARRLNREIIHQSDCFLTMEPEQASFVKREFHIPVERIGVLSAFHPDKNLDRIFDPYGMTIDDYMACAELINGCVKKIAEYF